ncbi:MAG: hypothetical protein K2O22_04800, partial [Anaeroplasmataceae bacterium]|nr:hypothetical protein [Anaeroplasmataceae bacterium]
IYIPNDIIIPIKNNEKESIKMNFKLFKDYAILEVCIGEKLVLKQNIEVYSKETFDIDLVIDIFK